MLGLFHWILGETPATPRGRVTLHVSVYEVPTSPDTSPDTTTTRASTTEYPESCDMHGTIGLLTRSGRSHYWTGQIYQSH